MRKVMMLLVLIVGVSKISFGQTWQQTWTEMSKEEKMMKLRTFRADNQIFLKDSLGMTKEQLKSIDSVNSIFLKELKKIEDGTGSDDEKMTQAKAIAKKRGEDLDGIMGVDKHARFTQYLFKKMEKMEG